MKVIEKDFVVGGSVLSKYNAYIDVEPELLIMNAGDRVLPAPFFYETGVVFSLIKQHEPGAPFYPNGGFEVRDGGGGVRHYDLDQVILHPAIIKHKPTLALMERREEKDAAIAQRALERGKKVKVKVEGARRGRPALDPSLKAARDAEKIAKSERSGGKRGRPKSNNTPIVKVSTGGKRGRPKVSDDVIARRVAAKAATRVRTGGKRGRPKSNRR